MPRAQRARGAQNSPRLQYFGHMGSSNNDPPIIRILCPRMRLIEPQTQKKPLRRLRAPGTPIVGCGGASSLLRTNAPSRNIDHLDHSAFSARSGQAPQYFPQVGAYAY